MQTQRGEGGFPGLPRGLVARPELDQRAQPPGPKRCQHPQGLVPSSGPSEAPSAVPSQAPELSSWTTPSAQTGWPRSLPQAGKEEWPRMSPLGASRPLGDRPASPGERWKPLAESGFGALVGRVPPLPTTRQPCVRLSGSSLGSAAPHAPPACLVLAPSCVNLSNKSPSRSHIE